MNKTKITAASQAIFIPIDDVLIDIQTTVNAAIKKNIEDKFPELLKNFNDIGEITDDGELKYKEDINYDYASVVEPKTKLNLDFKSFYFPSKKGIAEFGKLNNKEVELVVSHNSNKIVSDFIKEFNFEIKEVIDPYTSEKVGGLFIDSLKPYLKEMDPSKPAGTSVFPKNVNMEDTKVLAEKILNNIIMGPDKYHKKFKNMLRKESNSSPEFVDNAIEIFEAYKKKYKKYPQLVNDVNKFFNEKTNEKESSYLYKKLMSELPEDYDTDLDDDEIFTPLIFKLFNSPNIASVIGPLDPNFIKRYKVKEELIKKLKDNFNFEDKVKKLKGLQDEIKKLKKEKTKEDADDKNKNKLKDKLNYAVKEIKDKWQGKRMSDEDYKKLQNLQDQYKKDYEAAGKRNALVIDYEILKEELNRFEEEIGKITDNNDYLFRNYAATTVQILQETMKKESKSSEETKSSAFKVIQNNLKSVLDLLTKPFTLKNKNEEFGKILGVDPISVNLMNDVNEAFQKMYKENQEQIKKGDTPANFVDLKPYLTKSEQENPSNIKLDKETLKEFLENPTYADYINGGKADLDVQQFKEGGSGSVSPLAKELSKSPIIKKQVYKEKFWAEQRFKGKGGGYYFSVPGKEKGMGTVKSDKQVIDSLASVIVYAMIEKLSDPNYNMTITDSILKPATTSRSTSDFLKLMTSYIKNDTDVKGATKHPYNLVADQLDSLLTASWDKESIKKLLKPIEKKLIEILKDGDDKNFSIRDLMVDTVEQRENLTKELKEELNVYKDMLSKKAEKTLRSKLVKLFGLKVNDKGKKNWGAAEETRLKSIIDTIMHNKNTDVFSKNFKPGTPIFKLLDGLPADLLETILKERDLERTASLLNTLGSKKKSEIKDLAKLMFDKGEKRNTTFDILRKGSPDKAKKFFNKRAKTLTDIYKDSAKLKKEKNLVMSSYLIISEINKETLQKDYNPNTSIKFIDKLVEKLGREIKLYEGAKLLQKHMQEHQEHYEKLGSKEKTNYFKNTQEEIKKIKENITSYISNISTKATDELIGKLKKLQVELKDKENDPETLSTIQGLMTQYKLEEEKLKGKMKRLSSIYKGLDKGVFPKTDIENPEHKITKSEDRWVNLKKQIKEVTKLINLNEGFSEDGTIKQPSRQNPDYVNLDEFLKDLDFNTIVEVLDSRSIKDSRGKYSTQIGHIASNLIMQEIFEKDGNDSYKEDFLKQLSDDKKTGTLTIGMEHMLNAIASELMKKENITEKEFKDIKSDAL